MAKFGIFGAAVLALGLLAAPAIAQKSTKSAAGDPVAPITKFISSFNKGDAKAAAATHAADSVTIIDEVPPYVWTASTGSAAFDAWAADLDKNDKSKGITDGSVKLSKPKRKEISGDTAYGVVPVHYAYKEKGVPTVEDGEMTFSLRRVSGEWKISAWTWSGPNPHPVGGKKKSKG